MGQDREHSGATPQDSTLPDVSERLLRGLAAAQTPRQQEIARSIYSRLSARDSVDDVKGLIEEMARVIQQERRTEPGGTPGRGRQVAERRTGPGRTPGSGQQG